MPDDMCRQDSGGRLVLPPVADLVDAATLKAGSNGAWDGRDDGRCVRRPAHQHAMPAGACGGIRRVVDDRRSVGGVPRNCYDARLDGCFEAGVTMGKTILTVDDSRTMRDMLRLALSGAGHTVIQAEDGVDGVEVLEATVRGRCHHHRHQHAAAWTVMALSSTSASDLSQPHDAHPGAYDRKRSREKTARAATPARRAGSSSRSIPTSCSPPSAACLHRMIHHGSDGSHKTDLLPGMRRTSARHGRRPHRHGKRRGGQRDDQCRVPRRAFHQRRRRRVRVRAAGRLRTRASRPSSIKSARGPRYRIPTSSKCCCGPATSWPIMWAPRATIAMRRRILEVVDDPTALSGVPAEPSEESPRYSPSLGFADWRSGPESPEHRHRHGSGPARPGRLEHSVRPACRALRQGQ